MPAAFEDPVDPDDLRRWLGDAARPAVTSDDSTRDERRRRRGTRWALAGVAAALSLLVGTLLTGALLGTGARAPATDPSRVDPRPEPAHRTGGGDGAAAGPVAVRLVRDAVTATAEGVTTALDAAAAEPAAPLGDDSWIVRVHAVVLHGDRRRWHSASHEIWAVPVGRRDGAIVGLDRPWRVASDAERIIDTAWEPATIDVGEVRAALRRAGVPADGDLRAERHPHLDGVRRAVIGTGPRRRRVWFRTAPAVEVLGLDGSAPAGP